MVTLDGGIDDPDGLARALRRRLESAGRTTRDGISTSRWPAAARSAPTRQTDGPRGHGPGDGPGPEGPRQTERTMARGHRDWTPTTGPRWSKIFGHADQSQHPVARRPRRSSSAWGSVTEAHDGRFRVTLGSADRDLRLPAARRPRPAADRRPRRRMPQGRRDQPPAPSRGYRRTIGPVEDVDHHRRALGVAALEQRQGQRVLDLALDHPPQRPGAEDRGRSPAGPARPRPPAVTDERQPPLGQPGAQPPAAGCRRSTARSSSVSGRKRTISSIRLTNSGLKNAARVARAGWRS